MQFSFFNRIGQVRNGAVMAFEDFVNGVRFGKWAEVIARVQAEPDKPKRDKLKKELLPYVTPGGTFSHRENAGLETPSGCIVMDFDGLFNPLETKAQLAADPYTLCVALSASGRGCFTIVRIESSRHAEAFLALEAYYIDKYGIAVDTACKDVSRARFVTHDPGIVVNDKARVFKSYLTKKAQQRTVNILFDSSDLDHIFGQIRDRNIDLTQSEYPRFLRIGFALFSHFGPGGVNQFHAVCQQSDKYDVDGTEKQWAYICKSRNSGVGIGTFFYYCKEAGISLTTQKTQVISAVAKQAKKQGRDAQSAIDVLSSIDGIEPAESTELVEKIYGSNIDLKTAEGLSLLEQVELFLHSGYHLERNEVTRAIEDKRKPLEQKDYNTIFLAAVKVIGPEVRYELIERLINSDFVPTYNPLHEFFEKNKHRNPSGNIAALAACIESDTGFTGQGDFDPTFVHDFLQRWLVGLISSIFGKYSPLLLVLSGELQNTGKTEFFRRLLPPKLRQYYGESKLDAGKDDEILMTQKALICDDEMGGKSKMESKRLKELTSKQVFTLREPYGRKNVDLPRLAVLCGTSNDNALLSDPTGNRRIIPIHVLGINHTAYNAIDKTDLLIEAYNLLKEGFVWELDSVQIKRLNMNTTEFEQVRPEFELVTQFFRVPDLNRNETGVYLTNTEIKSFIEKVTAQRISAYKIGAEMKAAGFELKQIHRWGQLQKVYEVIRLHYGEGTDTPNPLGLP